MLALAETGRNRSMPTKTDHKSTVELISRLYNSISDEEALSWWGPVEGTGNHRAPETEEAGGGTLCSCRRLTSAH